MGKGKKRAADFEQEEVVPNASSYDSDSSEGGSEVLSSDDSEKQLPPIKASKPQARMSTSGSSKKGQFLSIKNA